MKKKTIIANWKLNGNKTMITDFLLNLHKHLTLEELHLLNIVIAFPNIYLNFAANILSDLGLNISLCAQDVSYHSIGSFTGETSVHMLKENQVKYVIVGHSERRLYHNETDLVILKKFIKIKDANLIPILCIGETLKDKQNQKTNTILQNQLEKLIKKFGNTILNNSIIAYEPIWAIGSGQSAQIEEICQVHNFIKKYITSFNEVTNNSTILNNFAIHYGGSVNEKNIDIFMNKNNIDGVLVGNASLMSGSFIKIIKKFAKKQH
ncbi:Triosephosphate isomerase [Buchnera aphidicola (Thelaxes suberi)]|uniref:triose-phosphate isomerase n=1 Tax=Buchnera aphidicola TaxID=9 RepID=UPI003463E8C4